jgi:hypothetical protein
MEITGNTHAQHEPEGTARLGILMLDTRFPRIAGDLGNSETWPFPVLIARIKDATPARVVDRKAAGGADTLDEGLIAAEVVTAGRRLVAAHPKVGAVVVECTNMPPYSDALRAALRLPVYDGYDFFCWFFAGLRGSPDPRWTPCQPSY